LVAENHHRTTGCAGQGPGPPGIGGGIRFGRPEHVLVAGGPIDPARTQELDGLAAYRSLRRPPAARTHPQPAPDRHERLPAPPALAERPHLREVLSRLEAEPGEIEQDLKVAIVRGRQFLPGVRLPVFETRSLAATVDLGVAWQVAHHVLDLGCKEVLEEEGAP